MNSFICDFNLKFAHLELVIGDFNDFLNILLFFWALLDDSIQYGLCVCVCVVVLGGVCVRVVVVGLWKKMASTFCTLINFYNFNRLI